MDKVTLGDTNISVSRLGLGTVKFGRNQGVKYPKDFNIPDEYTLSELLSLAKKLGINLLDTAPAYGTSEERLGRLLEGQRQDWIIIGKAGEEFENGVSVYDFSAKHFKASLDRSLKRLKTDYLDVFLIHSDGRDLDILYNDELIKTLHDFKSQGIIKAIGASTKTPEGGIKALELLDVAMVTYTPDYTEEQSVLDYAAANNKGIIFKKVLSSGHAQSIEKSLNFAFKHPCASAAIIGTINPTHLEDNIRTYNKVRLS